MSKTTNKKTSTKTSLSKKSTNKRTTNKVNRVKTSVSSRKPQSKQNEATWISRASYALFAISLFASLAVAIAVFRDLGLFILKYIFTDDRPILMEFYTYFLAPSMLGIILVSSILYLLLRSNILKRHPISLPSAIGFASIASFYLVFNIVF